MPSNLTSPCGSVISHAGVEVPQQNDRVPGRGPAPLTGTPRRPGILHGNSARKSKQQSETSPRPKGAGIRPLRESNLSQGAGSQSPYCVWSCQDGDKREEK
ncbi:hypothetical protein CHARACLAT_024433 [Characodon lateralis]|uniref:Uncharacterized protein n=1 Tax=Characodon lateralis TaxID=208331 RepID=A0ABU7E4M7_9TELE|nr:hypothetical protein [Characodon lateralis]